MKISLILLPLLATLCAGVTLKFEDCELLEVEGEFTVKDNDGKSVTIPLKDGEVNANASSCDSALAVDLPHNLRWVLVFNKQDFTLNQLVKFRPSELFSNDSMNSTMLSFDDDDDIKLKNGTSYICQTATARKFKPPTDFQVELKLQSIQVQAFDLPDGKFSPGEHCTEDEASSPSTPTETTPKKPTTSPSEEPSSPSEGPTTPEAPTTEPPKGMLTFRLKDKENKTCILMESHLEILLFYETTDGSAMAEVAIPEKGFKVNGTCPAGNAAILEVMFGKNSMRFNFGDSNGQAELSQITMTVDMDADHFPNATVKTLELSTEQTWTIPLGNDKTFFFCNADQSIPLIAEKGNASMTVAHLKVQAFNFAGQTFNGTGEDCDADKSTTPTPTPTPSPTPTPTPTPSPADVPNNYTVKDDTTKVTCIRVKGVMNMTIPYNTTEKKMENATVVVPHEFKVMGNCNASATTQTMTVTFFEDWKLEFAFTSNVSSKVQASQVGADPTYFAIESIKLTYKMDKDHFPKAASPNETMRAALQVPEGGLKAQMGGSYMCNSDVTFGGSEGASLQTTSFQYMAFNTNNKTGADFPDNGVTECSQDLKDNSVVPIAVGAALAALVIIVLIAYLIGRRRSRRSGYESV